MNARHPLSEAVGRMVKHAAVAVALGLICANALADSLGTIGPVYPIAEPDLLVQIQRKLEAKQASGEIERKNREAQEQARRAIEQPAPLTGIGTATARRSFHFDPTYVAERDVTDPVGRVIVPAGTRVNPLDAITLSRRLFFIDARDERQVRQAKALMEREGARLKLVLVAGSYMDLMRAWKRPVYFDQQGELVKRLGIVRVPALVGQDGKRLRIDEIPPGEPA